MQTTTNAGRGLASPSGAEAITLRRDPGTAKIPYPSRGQSTEIPIDTLHEEVVEALKTSKKPRHAFVRLQAPSRNTTAGTVSWLHSIATVNVENRPGQWTKIRGLIDNKNFKLIDWGNFPKEGSKLVEAHSGPDGPAGNPWLKLSHQLYNEQNKLVSTSRELLAKDEEISLLNKKVRELEANANVNNGKTNSGNSRAAKGTGSEGEGKRSQRKTGDETKARGKRTLAEEPEKDEGGESS